MDFESTINDFLKDTIGRFEKIEHLTGDASTRLYYRIFTANDKYILCRDHQLMKEPYNEYSFIVVYDLFMKLNLPVPRIYEVDRIKGMILLQDLGDDLLEDYYKGLNDDEKISIYKKILQMLISIQSAKPDDKLPFKYYFNSDKLMYEFQFFIDNALKGFFRAEISENAMEKLNSEFFKISTILDKPEIFVLNHRDFHSRNIIINNGIPFIIDFQDARLGLPQYDLVSLLRDSYTNLDNNIFSDLKYFFYDLAVNAEIVSQSRDEFDHLFDIMAFQRNLKALGTFCYQVSIKHNERYEKYIKPTINYIPDYVERNDELKGSWDLIQSYINF